MFDTGLNIVCGQWCHNGSVLAVGGQQVGVKDSSYICFYTPFGNVCGLVQLTVTERLSNSENSH